MTKARDIADFKFENIVDTGTEGTKVAAGTTAQRGSTTGQWRYNSTTGFFEGKSATTVLTLEPTPTVTSVDDTEVDSAGGGNQTIVITGTNFTSGATASFVGSSASFDASTTTVNSATQITAIAPKASFLNAQEPYKVKVTSASGLAGTSTTGLINVDNAPTWTTNAGSLGSIVEDATGNHFTVAASDAEGDTLAYTLQSGSLGGLSLNSSSGVISGDPTDVSSDTTNSFTLRATAGSKTADRAFSYITTNKVFDGSTQALAATNAETIRTLTSATSSDDGVYWIKPTGRTAIQVYCEFNSFGGWMLFCQSDGSGSPVPTTTGASGTITTLLGGTKGKHNDADFNAITWTHCWHGMTDNDSDGTGSGSGNNTMDRHRQNFTTSGNKFTINWTSSGNSALTSGNTDNGRNQIWSYKGIGGSSGSSLTSSSRQPSSTIINNNGSTDYTINNTNSYYIGSHDGGIGGSWIHSSDGSNGNMNDGFGSDYNNVPWTSRYGYWFFK